MNRKSSTSLGSEITAALEESIEHLHQRKKLRTTSYTIASLPKIRSSEIKQIRNKLHLTQDAFALTLGVSKKTVEAWESGRNTPQGPAVRIITLLDRQPKLLESIGVKIHSA